MCRLLFHTLHSGFLVRISIPQYTTYNSLYVLLRQGKPTRILVERKKADSAVSSTTQERKQVAFFKVKKRKEKKGISLENKSWTRSLAWPGHVPMSFCVKTIFQFETLLLPIMDPSRFIGGVRSHSILKTKELVPFLVE